MIGFGRSQLELWRGFSVSGSSASSPDHRGHLGILNWRRLVCGTEGAYRDEDLGNLRHCTV